MEMQHRCNDSIKKMTPLNQLFLVYMFFLVLFLFGVTEVQETPWYFVFLSVFGLD